MGEMAQRKNAKNRIYVALADLLTFKKIEDITISELIKKAEISRNTFYYHFYSPEDAFEAMIDSLIDGAQQRLAEVLESENSQFTDKELALYEYYYARKDLLLAVFASSKSRLFLIKFIRFIKTLYGHATLIFHDKNGNKVVLDASDGEIFDFLINRTAFALYGFLEWWAATNFSITPQGFLDLQHKASNFYLDKYILGDENIRRPTLIDL